MTNKRSLQLLARSFEERLLVKITVCVPSEENEYGIVLGLSPDGILVRSSTDFQDNGFLMLPTKLVRSVTRTREVIFWQGMMEADNLLPTHLQAPQWLNYSSWECVLRSLMCVAKLCIIRSELPEDIRNHSFLIGRVIGVTKDRASFHAFDAQARWDYRPTTVELDAITAVQWDDQYSSVYARHLPPLPTAGSK